MKRSSQRPPRELAAEFAAFLRPSRDTTHSPFRPASDQQAKAPQSGGQTAANPCKTDPEADRREPRKDSRDGETGAPALPDCVLDPANRVLLGLRPPESVPQVSGALAADVQSILAQVAEQTQCRFLVGRNGSRSTVHLNIAAGDFAGTAMTLESDWDKRVTLHISAGHSAQSDSLVALLRERFQRRGIECELIVQS